MITRRWSAVARRAIVAIVLAVCATFTALVLAYYRHPKPVRAANAAGDAACLSCHREKSAFDTTAHRLTSRDPTRSAIAGAFTPGRNVLWTSDPQLHFRMDSTAAGFTEAALVHHGSDSSVFRVERIAMVIGTGRKGQSYAYERPDSALYQLPVSYWRGIGWINSPGYRDGTANFGRPIAPRCLECHASSMQSVSGQAANRYDLAHSILGITCETCHGSGVAHVARERSPMRNVLLDLFPRTIVNPARLSRDRQLEACALCHGGIGTLKSPAFSYLPGQPLADHLIRAPSSPNDEIDVHGNQVALLERSACFRSSNMTCATCHDVHKPQHDVAELSGRCLSCHTVQSCGLYPQQGQALVGRCVDCHMPTLPSSTIVAADSGRLVQARVRTHWIKVYPVPAPAGGR